MIKIVALMMVTAAGILPAGAFADDLACPPGLPQGLCLSEAWETIGVEHEDRMNRLKRLSDGTVGFTFSTENVPAAEHKLDAFPTDIPVLRVTADQDVFFDTGRSEIRREAYKLLDIIAKSLQNEPPDVVLFVAGHTDSRGSIESNFDLGMQRAEAVSSALVRRGIYQAEIYQISFGELMPIASNDNARNRARNRRVEFLFAGQSPAIVNVLQRQAVSLCDDVEDADGDTCRKNISLSAELVSVSLEGQQQVLELNKAEQSILADTSLTAVEVSEKRQAIEVERNRIPVEIKDKRIAIELSDHRKAVVSGSTP